MTTALAHRGPDDSGTFLDGPVGLGHRRLAIIDLSGAGRQPMPNDRRDVWITYNGESYNYRSHITALEAKGYAFPSSSDTNVILNLYQEYGIDCLSMIDGMFAFGIWDARKKALFLARDRIGIKPLYYYDDGKTLLFASELKAFLTHPDFRGEIDHSALANYFRFMSIPDPQCIFRNVKKLPGGHYLKVERDGISLHQYWDIGDFAPSGALSFDEAAGDFSRRFDDCVARHMVADVPVGAFLSGGVDSSGVVAHASGHASEPMQTFSAAFKGLPDYDESPYAELVARRYGTRHRSFSLEPDFTELLPEMTWHADEPFAVSSSFPLYLLAREASKHVKVVLTGDGADEIFAGYPWRHGDSGALPGWMGNLLAPLSPLLAGRSIRALPPSHPLQRLRRLADPAEAYAAAFSTFHSSEFASLLDGETRAAVLATLPGNPVASHYRAPAKASRLDRKLYAELKTTLVSEMLTKVDRMTMAFGLEARVPFLDHTLVQWAFTLPDSFKEADGQGKRIVKSAFEPMLPPDMLYRPKHGFNVPLPTWFKGELRDWVRDSLSPDTVKNRGLFNLKAVETMMDEHENGIRDNANRILSALCLELWFDQYFDGNVRS
jgi:asparagine synthase (glutamine-hydrolysing)